MPSQLQGEEPELLLRISQLRSYVAMREAMKSDKEREIDARPHGPVAELVAKVQYMLQQEDEAAEQSEAGGGADE